MSEDLYEQMQQAIIDGELEDAERLAREGLVSAEESSAACDTAIARDPANLQYYLAAARGALVLGDLARARSLATSALELHPNLGQAVHILGRVALHGDASRALPILTRAVNAEWRGRAQRWLGFD